MRVLILVLSFAVAGRVVAAESAAVGARVYAERCSGCHGADGRGDGPAAAALVPKPRNFRDPAFWHDRTTASIASIVRDGKPGTMMAPFKDALSDAEIDAVAAYLSHFDPTKAAAKVFHPLAQRRVSGRRQCPLIAQLRLTELNGA